MRRTPFHRLHNDHGAKFVDFNGWEMPMMYTSIHEEHNRVREHMGLFDVSHMGRLKVSGRHARRLLERVLTRRITDMAEKTCRYSMVCNEHGGVMDDVIVYRYSDHWLLVVNAANREKIVKHFQQHVGELSVKVEDQTESTAMMAVQGPDVMEFIGGKSREIPQLKRYQFAVKNLIVVKLTVSRTGYTGEDGVEVILPANMAETAIKLLLRDSDGQELKPCGLGARDTLRIEAAMPLYGHEIDEHIDPITAGLNFAVTLDKDEQERGEPYVGQDALKKIAAEGPVKKRIGLKLEGRRTPRQEMEIRSGDRTVGHITSGCLSPTLGYPIAMGYVDREAPDTDLNVPLGAKSVPAELTELPFYRPGK